MTLTPGLHLGPYEILAPLGAGGMGEVYRARDTRLKRDVAIKVIPEHLAKDREALNRFEREAQAIAALSHPNILAVYDVGTEQGVSFVVMELLEGETLRERLRRSAIAWRKAVEYGVAIADGLAAAHAKGIIHRDLKPENIFLTKDGVVKILDFGLARITPVAGAVPPEKQADTPTMTLDTRPGTVLGTVNYMSPEQISGRTTDARTDVFSFGCVLYEMVTGSRAFAGKSVAETTTAILRDEPSLIADSGQVIPVELDREITRCLEKKPEQRIQSARDLAFTLRDLLSDSGLSKPTAAYAGPRMRTMLGVQLAVGIVAVVALLLTMNVGGWRQRLFVPSASGSIDSLAILPFVNASDDPDTEYLSEGIPATIINSFSRLPHVRVVPWDTAYRFKGREEPSSVLGRELKVAAVLTGQVLARGDNLTIQVELVNVVTDRHLWGERYPRKLTDILDIEEDVAKKIAEALQLELTAEGRARLAKQYTVAPEAHMAYLRGRFWWNKRAEADLRKAIDFFDQAIAIDPGYALAYVGKADCYAVASGSRWLLPANESYAEAVTAALAALRIDETLGEAHSSLGLVKHYNWGWPGAEEAHRRAVQLSPGYATGHHWYAMTLGCTGRLDEAIREIQHAQELDPLSLMINVNAGWVFYAARRYDQAIEECRKALDLAPDFAPAYEILGAAYEQKGMYQEAVAQLKRAVSISDAAPDFVAFLGYTYAVAGMRDEAEKILRKLNDPPDGRHASSYYMALIHIGLGEKDKAFEWLEKAYKQRDAQLVFLRSEPVTDPLRDDPRFDNLLRRIGFEPEPRSQPTAEHRSTEPASRDRIMLAVLPFKNLGAPDDEYFADGISDEIRSRLAAVRKLGVISRASAFQYKQSRTRKPNRQIGSELGVDYLVDGTIRWDKRAGGAGRVRITPELIRISDDITLWSQPYNRVIEDIFEVQSDIAGQVIKQLNITLFGSERQAIEVIPTESPDAYRAYLRGLDYAERLDSEEDYGLAIQMFERAVSLDPDFALAYAKLSQTHSVMHHGGYDLTEDRSTKAKVAADRALELQPELPEAHLALGWYYYGCRRDYERALGALATAETGLPNDARILQLVGFIRRRQGRFDAAVNDLKRAFELSPLRVGLATSIARTYFCLRKYPQAERWFDKSISLAPNLNAPYQQKARIYLLWHGDRERARAVLEEMPRQDTPYSVFCWLQQELFERDYQGALDRLASISVDRLAMQARVIPKAQLSGLVYHLMDEPERARSSYDAARILLEKALKEQPDDHRVRSSLGIVYASLGRKEEAIREGKLGVELFPVSKDAMIGPSRVRDLAFIYVLVGEYDAALDRIEYLLSIPSGFSIPLLRLDPRWDPLRDHPRYKNLLRRIGLEPPPVPSNQEP